MQKKYFILIFIVSVILVFKTDLTAQRNLKYKDVFKTVLEKSREEAYSTLLIYQKQDPYFPNTYFQLGLIAQYWSKEYDALTNIRDVKLFIYNTDLYFGLANGKITEKDVRKNAEYYKNVKPLSEIEKPSFEDVQFFIKERMEQNKEYERNVNIVTNYFNKSIEHYNRCTGIFKEINEANLKIKDIYLTADDDFLQKLTALESSFDSTIFYLQNYQTAIKNYPIKDYNQKYKLFPIETYRLQGLTSSNFLNDEIHLWDYGTWTKKVRNVLNNEITPLRKDIINANNQLDKSISNIQNSKTYKADFNKYTIDERLINLIRKFDYNSMLIALFKYKLAKQDFLALSKAPLNDTKDTSSSYTLLQRSRYYNELIKNKKPVDSLRADFEQRIKPDDINKYKQFFEDNFGGESGLIAYVQNEKNFLDNVLQNALGSFKTFVLRDLLHTHSIVDLPYRNTTIRLKIEYKKFDEAQENEYVITAANKDNQGNYYASGYIKQRNPGVSAFVLKTNKLQSIEWLKIYPVSSSSDDYGSFIQATENGCKVLITSIKDDLIKNRIFSLDKTGKLESKKEISVALIPRYFNYDEINENYLIAFKGMSIDPFESLSDNLVINKYKGSDLSEEWTNLLNVKGNLVDIVKMNQSYYVFANFTKYAAGSKIISGKAGVEKEQTNAILFVLNQSGEIEQTIPYYNENPYFIAKAFKISSNTINLFGFQQPLISIRVAQKSSFQQPVYLLINTKGEIYYDNRK